MKSKINTVAAGVILFLITAPVLFPGCAENVSVQNDSELAVVPASNLETEAAHIIQQGLTDKSPQVRANAIEIVSDIPADQARKFMPEVQRLLRDDFVPVRFAAATAVGDTAYAPAKNDVILLTRDKESNVRLAAFYALVQLGDS